MRLLEHIILRALFYIGLIAASASIGLLAGLWWGKTGKALWHQDIKQIPQCGSCRSEK